MAGRPAGADPGTTAGAPLPQYGKWGELRRHGDETRRRIIGVALALVADHGFAATSTREISECLGFTKAALYYHFRTKDDLLAAIVQPAASDLEALVESATPASSPSERRRVVEGYADLVSSHADLIQVVSDDPAVRKSPALRAVAPHYVRLVQILAGTEEPSTAGRAQVRAALGAIHSVLIHAAPDDDAATLRQSAVTAATRVLGLPPARRPAET
ncbi:MAG: TetR/AcrR family transcriptional regulator, partial [Solirubrobacteraceae bacterium]